MSKICTAVLQLNVVGADYLLDPAHNSPYPCMHWGRSACSSKYVDPDASSSIQWNTLLHFVSSCPICSDDSSRATNSCALARTSTGVRNAESGGTLCSMEILHDEETIGLLGADEDQSECVRLKGVLNARNV